MTNDPEELRIALNLVKNIKENNLLIRNLDSIDRIFKLYFNQINRNQSEEKLIVNFIFQCIDTYGINASSLFRYLRNSNEKNDIIHRFHQNYEEKFSFNIINSFLFENSNEKIESNNEERKMSVLIFSLVFSFFILFLFFIRNSDLKKKIVEYEKVNKNLQDTILKIGEKQIEYNNDQKRFKDIYPIKVRIKTENHSKQWIKIFSVLILTLIEMAILLTMELPHNFHLIYDSFIFFEYILHFFYAPGNFVYIIFITVPWIIKMILLLDIFVDDQQIKLFLAEIHMQSKVNIYAAALIALINYYCYI